MLVSNCVFFSIRALSLLKKNKEENTVTYQESPPWLPTMFETPCVETILYPEFSQSNRQANIYGRTMNAGNHRLLLTSSPACHTSLETTENYTLQIQRKNQVCLSRPRVSTRPRVPVPILVTAITRCGHVVSLSDSMDEPLTSIRVTSHFLAPAVFQLILQPATIPDSFRHPLLRHCLCCGACLTLSSSSESIQKHDILQKDGYGRPWKLRDKKSNFHRINIF